MVHSKDVRPGWMLDNACNSITPCLARIVAEGQPKQLEQAVVAQGCHVEELQREHADDSVGCSKMLCGSCPD